MKISTMAKGKSVEAACSKFFAIEQMLKRLVVRFRKLLFDRLVLLLPTMSASKGPFLLYRSRLVS